MKKLAIVFHSAHGHTEFLARHILAGAQGTGLVDAALLKAEDLTLDIGRLPDYDGLIWGSPTYLGGVSAPFKAMMDATGRLWRQQALRGRLAAGFTVSSLPAGDKQSTLLSMFVFSMQHGMLWAGNPVMPEQQAGVAFDEAANRLGSWSGLMAQAAHGGPADAFAPGDVKGAQLFGRHVTTTLASLPMPAGRA